VRADNLRAKDPTTTGPFHFQNTGLIAERGPPSSEKLVKAGRVGRDGSGGLHLSSSWPSP
jgi:hypothetical protein